jgi:NADH-quinone oxidoreductase subunit L
MAYIPMLLLLPLFSFILVGFLGAKLPPTITSALSCGTAMISLVISVSSVISLSNGSPAYHQTLWHWLRAGSVDIEMGIYVDQLSAVMMLVVTGVGFLILVYSVGYMENDPGFNRFFCFMNLFILAMSVLVLADSYLFLLFGWAGVGLASFLLIGFWYQRRAAVAAARKAFILNVVGDVGLMLAMFLMLQRFGSVQYSDLLLTPTILQDSQIAGPISVLLLVAAAAKSAQFPLHVWLPDAMEGPTPVSALIHAATMVAAGVYLVARSFVFFSFSPLALTLLALVGATSALFGAVIAVFQFDIKRVLAYSTMSQLGYMFMAESVGASSTAISYLAMHALFKSLLFMAAGGLIHAVGGEQDLRRMGGLRRSLPITFWSFVVGGLALAGVPPFAGFWSKEAILGALLESASNGAPWHYALWVVGVVTTFFSALYMFRLIFIVFFGPARVKGQHRFVEEVEGLMAGPMVALLVLSSVAGFLLTSFQSGIDSFLGPALGVSVTFANGSRYALSTGLSLLMALLGIGLAWWRFGMRGNSFQHKPTPVSRLLRSGLELDRVGKILVVTPLLLVGRSSNQLVETEALTGVERGIGSLLLLASTLLRRLQTGHTRTYLLIMFASAVILILYSVMQVVIH